MSRRCAGSTGLSISEYSSNAGRSTHWTWLSPSISYGGWQVEQRNILTHQSVPGTKRFGKQGKPARCETQRDIHKLTKASKMSTTGMPLLAASEPATGTNQFIRGRILL